MHPKYSYLVGGIVATAAARRNQSSDRPVSRRRSGSSQALTSRACGRVGLIWAVTTERADLGVKWLRVAAADEVVFQVPNRRVDQLKDLLL
jgi:hypothetical protein